MCFWCLLYAGVAKQALFSRLVVIQGRGNGGRDHNIRRSDIISDGGVFSRGTKLSCI
jgi:hypothetical protein